VDYLSYEAGNLGGSPTPSTAGGEGRRWPLAAGGGEHAAGGTAARGLTERGPAAE